VKQLTLQSQYGGISCHGPLMELSVFSITFVNFVLSYSAASDRGIFDDIDLNLCGVSRAFDDLTAKQPNRCYIHIMSNTDHHEHSI